MQWTPCTALNRSNAGEIAGSQWKSILKHVGSTDEEIRGVQRWMGPPSASEAESESPRPRSPCPRWRPLIADVLLRLDEGVPVAAGGGERGEAVSEAY
jgi:hypothetical protein